MRIRYAIEKEIEVPDNLTDMDIDDIISKNVKERMDLIINGWIQVKLMNSI